MLQKSAKYILFLSVLFLASCAKRGSITGGLKDTLAPVLKNSLPKNFSTQFKGNEIKLTFDEYIKLKNINKQLVVSPPMKNEPIITPTTASKYISIKIKDTLLPNTTYSFNFGQSIADNNEGNPYNQFKYVFSTGEYIDSLTIGGRIKDAYDKEVTNFVSIMLYEVNENYTDSIIYKEAPRYITNTLDSLKTFRLENLKAGKYLLVALKDLNNNNKFNPKEEKIGFIKQPITIPNDTVFELELFQEKLPLKAYKPVQVSGNRILVGYDGTQDFKKNRPKIVLKNNDEILETIVTQFPKKDSLQVWYKSVKADSLQMEISTADYQKNYSFKIKNQKKDSLNVRALQSGGLNFRDRFTLESETPLVKFDSTKIKIINKDSVSVKYTTEYDAFNQRLYFDFKKEPLEKYSVTLLPNALTDFYEKQNDTLLYQLTTKELADYSNLTVTLQNVKRFPLIIELTNAKGDVIASEYSEGKTSVEFGLLQPDLLWLRAIYDDNKNGVWDSGNFMEKRQAEEVIYSSKGLESIRANWDPIENFDLSMPYVPETKKKVEKKKQDPAKKKKRSSRSSIF
ncbi:Ig-like domain-containing protein [Flavobacterium sp. TAB 87]|uniref:Ig-like domain-containing protein n=1 Tax=Flavobacterium sp. TAB 87 TaxID=1729581 RepID=UPI00076DD350|nr:Ig-like domain-containing protein [Flavobacterium sp. TAB 87]KVV13239.1 hypothetical protein AP058_02602 [Flavobacterium sp. TAB 87]